MNVTEWIRVQGSIAGFPYECRSNPGVMHPLVAHDHDAYIRAQHRFRMVSEEPRCRAAPDIVHMLRECDLEMHATAIEMGYEILCDPSLSSEMIMPDFWPRAHNWFIGPLQIFRNPDSGYGLAVNGYRLIGPGQCGERRWYRGTEEKWCYRPFGHQGEHAFNIASAVAANRA